MGKRLDKLGSFDTFRAPWETETGAEAEVDKKTLKRLIFNLKEGEAKALDAREEANDKISTLEKDLEEAKAEAASANGDEAQKKIDRLTKQLSDEKEKVSKLEKDKERADLRSEVLEGLDPKYAKYVTGETREDLEKSLEEVKKDFGLDQEPNDDEDEDEDDELPSRVRPRVSLKSVIDPDPNAGKDAFDENAIADQILSGGRLSL